MARIARVVVPEYPHHIIQRGNNRAKIFSAIKTRKKYLKLLKDYAQKHHVSVLAYCLMSNHVHLLLKPHQAESLAKLMQGVNQAYTKYINRRYKRTGRLWESRYYSCVIDKESYFWMVARYIEQNPVRARIVKQAEDYSYTSARAHVLDEPDEVLSEKMFPEDDRSEYIKFLKSKVSDEELNRIRATTSTGRPLGSKKFITRLVRLLKVDFTKRVPGRPHK